MIPTETLDPRDPWMKVRRMEVFRWAQEHGVKDIADGPNGIPPKNIMVNRLKALGIGPPSGPPRPIGKNLDFRSGDTAPDSHHTTHALNIEPTKTVTIDADEFLEQQWSSMPAKETTYNEARAELKAAGVKLDRKWTKERVFDELGKLRSGQNAA